MFEFDTKREARAFATTLRARYKVRPQVEPNPVTYSVWVGNEDADTLQRRGYLDARHCLPDYVVRRRKRQRRR